MENPDVISNNFETLESEVLHNRVRFAVLYLCLPLFLSFSVIDYFYINHLWVEFIYLRLTVFPLVG